MKRVYLYQLAEGQLVNPRLDGIQLGPASSYTDAELNKLVAERNRHESKLEWAWCLLRDDY
jgi:hypothetical protein